MQAALLPPELPFAAPVPRTSAETGHLLDDLDQWRDFSRPLPGDAARWESYLAIEGMYCPACSLAVEDALGGLPGVHSVEVNGATTSARIVWSPQAGRPSQWLRALQRAGYGGLPAGDRLDAVPRQREQRALLWRWLVAGFCMMQVMMYAWPAYVAAPGEITADVAGLLRWASWLLTLPVVLFSCQPFLASAWRDLRNARLGMDVPVALGILIAFGASTAATFDPYGRLGGEVWYDSVTMFVFFLLSGRLLEQRLRERTTGALEALMRRLPQTVERLGDDDDATAQRVAVSRLEAGDRIRVLAGETMPADGTVLAGESQVDEALITGESRSLLRRPGDSVIAGSQNLGGTLLVRVDRTGGDTRHAAIVALMERASVEKPALARQADRLAGPFLGAVLLAALGAAAWWWPQGPGEALGIAVAVLIVTCPCALSLATPAASLAAAGALAREGVLVRRLEALEGGATVDSVVFDKTGTLTDDCVSVRAIHTRDGIESHEALALAAALARQSLHPASRAIATAAGEVGWTAADVQEHAGLGVAGTVTDDSGWLPRMLRLGSAEFCGLPQSDAGVSQAHLADELGWLATFDLDETLRPGALQAVACLQRDRMSVEMLSGDRNTAAQRLALRAGIATARGQQSPQDKLARVRELQTAGHRVAMVGDGMNDGPVLAIADVSIAMGQGVPLAQARSDFIVLGSEIERVPMLLAHARKTHRVIRQNLAWAAGYNAVCVPLALAGLMPPWFAGLGMAVSSLVVVANAARLSLAPSQSRSRSRSRSGVQR